MRTWFEQVGRAFLHPFIAALIVYGVGVASAPDLAHMYLVGTAAIIAAVGAGLSGVLVYFPSYSLIRWLGNPVGAWADSFLYAFVASLAITLTGVAGAPNFGTVHALVVSAILGAFAAGVRAIEGAFTANDHPAVSFGLPAPPPRRS